jgi:parvulin-like peptidyl-prolyl isomerase
MKPLSLLAVILVSAAVLASTACGGESGVPEGAVAVVDGNEIPKSELDRLMERTKKGFVAQDQEFPKAGTPEYQNLQQTNVAFLVQREQLQQAADELGIEVTEKDIDKEVADFVEQRFAGKRKDLEKALAEQGLTEEDLREILATTALSRKVFDEITKDVKISDEEINAYYAQNQSQYSTPASRDVRHILIGKKKPNGDVDYAKNKVEADRVYAELQGGGDFAALARQLSDDEQSAKVGGKLTINRGETVPAFDETSFQLEQGEISKPVRTEFGYHIIEALSPVREAKTTPLAKVRASIRATLGQQRKSEIIDEWAETLRSESDVSYAQGFAPPELPDDPAETTTETE